MGCHGGERRVKAPGRVNQSKTSVSGAETTLEHSMPMSRL